MLCAAGKVLIAIVATLGHFPVMPSHGHGYHPLLDEVSCNRVEVGVCYNLHSKSTLSSC